MILLKNIFCVIAFFLFLNSAEAKDTPSAAFNPQIQNEYLAKYFNSFGTIGELIEGMQFSGFFEPEDSQEILLRLKEIGVDPKVKLPLVKAEGNRIRFGKTAVLVNDPDGKIKTGDGHFINISKTATAADIIMKSYYLQKGKKVSSVSGLFLNPAWADIVDNVDAVESGIGSFAKHVMSVILGDIFSPVAGVTVGLAGGVINFGTWAIRTWLEKGTVRCDGKDYVALGFEDGRSPLEIWNGEKEKKLVDINQFCSYAVGAEDALHKIIVGHSTTLCKVGGTGIQFFVESLEKRKKNYYPIKETVLKREVGDPIPRCTPELASRVTEKLKARLRAGIDAVKKGKPSRLVKPSDDYGTWQDYKGVH
ncbi:MAG: hypothetical protein ACXWRG_18335 [Bdellovibrio sp.]